MSFLQGRTPANAIDVEEASSSRPNILYGNEWQEQATGEECLRMNFPEVLEKGTVKIAFGLPTATKKMPVISINGVSKLNKLPPLDTVDEARMAVLSEAEESQQQEGSRSSKPLEPWGVEISNFGAIDSKVISMSTRVIWPTSLSTR